MQGRCIRFVLVFVLLFLLGGCAWKEEVPNHAVMEEEIEREGKDYIVIGYSQVGSESDYRLANTESLKSTFTAENGYYLLFEDAQQKQENQIKAIRNFILQEVDYIILDPIVETGWDAVLKEAKEAGIPVLLTDRSVQVEDERLYTCWIGSDFRKEGQMAGEWLKKYLQQQNRQHERIRIVTLQGTLNSSAQIGRTKGFRDVLEKQKNWVMLDYQSGDFTQMKGQEVMEYLLDSYEKIDVVVSENDNMTFGAIDAMKEAGRAFGTGGGIIVISFDAVRASFKHMMAGEINADFECNPLLGPLVERVIQDLEDKKEVEKIQYVDESYYDASMDLNGIMKSREY